MLYMIIEAIIVAIPLLLVIAAQCYLIHDLNEKWDAKEKDLLNRLMSRNYETFIQGEIVQQPPKPLTPEEIYEQQLERGIPV
jgi:predicted Holliday junction resolvase-like endonuclease